jgi:hypothetical protein
MNNQLTEILSTGENIEEFTTRVVRDVMPEHMTPYLLEVFFIIVMRGYGLSTDTMLNISMRLAAAAPDAGVQSPAQSH